MSEIHPTAIVSPNAIIGKNVYIGPFAIVETQTIISENCYIDSHSIVRKGTTIRQNVKIDSHCVIGGLPQHLKFSPETESYVEIGEDTVLREYVTIHRSLEKNKTTRIGNNCFLMGASHVGHDSIIGDQTIVAQAALLGGHVEIGNNVFVGGGAKIHQFIRVGHGVMIGGGAVITCDIPPHMTAAERNQLAGLNLVGLRRRNAEKDAIQDLKQLYNVVLTKSMSPAKLCNHAKEMGLGKTKLGKEFLEFFEKTNRVYCKPKRR